MKQRNKYNIIYSIHKTQLLYIHNYTHMTEQDTGTNVLTLTTLLSLFLTSRFTLPAVTLPVQVYCPPSEVRSGENFRLLVVIVPLVVASFTVIIIITSTRYSNTWKQQQLDYIFF